MLPRNAKVSRFALALAATTTAFSSLRTSLSRSAVPEDFEQTPEYKAFARQHMVDEEELLRQSSFPIPPKEQKDNFWWLTKKFLVSEAPEKIFSGDGTLLAENFRFVGPYIGPLDKKAFYGQRDAIDFFQSFPDASAQFHNFRRRQVGRCASLETVDPPRCEFTACCNFVRHLAKHGLEEGSSRNNVFNMFSAWAHLESGSRCMLPTRHASSSCTRSWISLWCTVGREGDLLGRRSNFNRSWIVHSRKHHGLQDLLLVINTPRGFLQAQKKLSEKDWAQGEWGRFKLFTSGRYTTDTALMGLVILSTCNKRPRRLRKRSFPLISRWSKQDHRHNLCRELVRVAPLELVWQ
eukprot:g17269.t1